MSSYESSLNGVDRLAQTEEREEALAASRLVTEASMGTGPGQPIGEPRADNLKEPIRRLFAALEARGVRYCHWKSNIRLGETLAGAQDIDLLADRRDAELLQAVLPEAGFKLASSHAGLGHLGLFHAFALDETTGTLVDLHAHYQIVSGDSLVKNYRLPVEDLLLSRTRYLDGVKVPSPEVELLLFLLRIALKHVSPIEIVKVNLHYRKVSAELAWLREAADLKEAEALLPLWFPNIEPALLQQLSHAIAKDGAVLRRVVLGWWVAWRLRKLRRLNLLQSAASRLWRTYAFVRGRVKKHRDHTLLTGGAIIALVGPKGVGKSTLSRGLAETFGRHLQVWRIHAGKPPATALTFLPRLFVPLGRILLPNERLGEYEKPSRRCSKTYSLLYVIRMTLLAHERRKLLFRARRASTSGMIVISDRYPSDDGDTIDSSQFDDEAVKRCRSRFKRWLMRKERALYGSLPRPSLVLQLVAPMDTAIRRDAERMKRGGPNPEAVRRRWNLETRAQFMMTPRVVIDTDRPLGETVRVAIQAVWSAL